MCLNNDCMVISVTVCFVAEAVILLRSSYRHNLSLVTVNTAAAPVVCLNAAGVYFSARQMAIDIAVGAH